MDDDRSNRKRGVVRRADRWAHTGTATLTALRGVIYATIILVAAGTVGQVVLDAIGIRMPSLKVAGGIILFLFGVQMLFGKMDAKDENIARGGDATSRCFRWRCLPSPDPAR